MSLEGSKTSLQCKCLQQEAYAVRYLLLPLALSFSFPHRSTLKEGNACKCIDIPSSVRKKDNFLLSLPLTSWNNSLDRSLLWWILIIISGRKAFNLHLILIKGIAVATFFGRESSKVWTSYPYAAQILPDSCELSGIRVMCGPVDTNRSDKF